MPRVASATATEPTHGWPDSRHAGTFDPEFKMPYTRAPLTSDERTCLVSYLKAITGR